MTSISRSLALGFATLACAGAAQATVTRTLFSGRVTGATGAYAATLPLDTPFQALLVFDDATPDTDPSPIVGSYASTPYTGLAGSSFLQISAGAYSWTTSIGRNVQIAVRNDTIDRFVVQSFPSIGGASITLRLAMQDLTGNALSSDVLVLPPPPLLSFANSTIRVDESGTAGFTGALTSVSAVPGPTELTVMMAGLAAAAGFARRRRVRAA